MDVTVRKMFRNMAKMNNYRLCRPEKVQNSGPKQGPVRTLARTIYMAHKWGRIGPGLQGPYHFVTWILFLREGFNKKNIKSYGIFHQNFTTPPFYWKKTLFSHNFFYVFIMFITTQFGENFKEKIIFCLFKNVWIIKVKVISLDQHLLNLSCLPVVGLLYYT